MDEPTASLDSINENLFLEAVEDMKKDKTIIMITHRLNLNTYADRIIYFGKDGYME